MAKIRVDIDELIGKLEEIKNDYYVTVELDIQDDEEGVFGKELVVGAVTFEDDEPIGYGVIAETEEEIL